MCELHSTKGEGGEQGLKEQILSKRRKQCDCSLTVHWAAGRTDKRDNEAR